MDADIETDAAECTAAIRHLGDREFLVCGRWWIPVDKIKEIETQAEQGRVHIEADGEIYRWEGEEADALRTFLGEATWR